MADTIAVADRFLALAHERDMAFTPMQLLKLVYIAHGWTLALRGRPLINDPVEAWQYGPVIRRLYERIRHFKGQSIVGRLGGEDDLTADDTSIIEQVFQIYGRFSGAALSRITHADGTPWHSTYVPGQFGIPIPTDLIADHYERLAAERRQAS